MICLSKALTGGYLPLAATVVSESIYSAFLSDDRSKAFFHGHSYTANPLGCAVALASLSLFRREPILQRVKAMESHFRKRLESMRSLGIVGDVRGIGGVAVVELERRGGYLDSIGPRLYDAFLKRGLLLRPLGSILYFMPPYVITAQEVDWAFDQIAEVLLELDAG